MRKIANDDLDKMNHQEVPATDTEELADIRDVRIDPKSSKEEKLRTFLEQIKTHIGFAAVAISSAYPFQKRTGRWRTAWKTILIH